MDQTHAALRRIASAQTRNAHLTGTALVDAAQSLATLAERTGQRLMAADAVGERLIGAAIVIRPRGCRLADTTQRLGGDDVLLVSGAVAGPFGLVEAARTAAAVGAGRITAAVLGGSDGPVPGIAEIIALCADHPGVSRRGQRGSRPRDGTRPG